MKYNIALLRGDGIGPEIVDSAVRVMEAVGKKYGHEFFEVIEEDIDVAVEEGFRADEWFDKYVDNRNLKRGDKNEFWTDEDVLLSVVKVAGDHHDFNLGRVRIA